MQQNIGYIIELWISVYSTMDIKVCFLLEYPKSLDIIHLGLLWVSKQMLYIHNSVFGYE